MPPHLVDTNVVARTVLTTDPLYAAAVTALDALKKSGAVLNVAAQSIVELRSLASRPQASNGLGLTAAQADKEVDRVRGLFDLLPDVAAILEEWQALVASLGIVGTQVYDARLVAVMRVYDVSHILTFNPKHFQRYPGITVIDPASV